ncbi:MAG: lysophospholipid acyltransferase family protein [Aestuariivirga sp.]
MVEAVERLGSLESAQDFTFTYSRPEQRLWQRLLVFAIERATGAERFERLYRQWSAAPPADETIFAAGLRLLGIELSIDGAVWSEIPRTGPLLIIANHPFGVIDGLAVAHLATSLRPDAKVMTHSLLCQPPEAKAFLLPVDFAATAAARAATVATCRRAIGWLADGHCLAMFPGGSVSTSQSPWRGPASDPAWYPFLGKLASQHDLTVLPVFVHGQNSRLFQIASHIDYALRIALLFRESARLAGGELRLSIGAPVAAAELAKLGGRETIVKELRRRCYALAGETGPDPELEFRWPKHIRWN